jgi:tetratricopeptide (TPR) repeat protein
LFVVLSLAVAHVAIRQAWYAQGGALVFNEISPTQYARTQPGIILHYLRLCFWPQGQCFDYGWSVARTAEEIVPGVLVIGSLLVLTVLCISRWPAWGFLGAWFFVFLAPTSSFLPVRDLANEHRMYLPLIAVVVAVVMGGYRLSRRLAVRFWLTAQNRRALQVAGVAFAVLALGATTYTRNEVYRSHVALWADVVEKAPENGRGHYNLAHSLESAGRLAEAVHHYQRSIELDPADAVSLNNLANLLAAARPGQAIQLYQASLRIDPGYAEAHYNLAGLFARHGRFVEATEHCRRAVELRPDFYQAHTNLGSLLAKSQPEVAFRHFEVALQIRPDYPDGHFHLANFFVSQGAIRQGVQHLQTALRLRPDWPEARRNLQILFESGG